MPKHDYVVQFNEESSLYLTGIIDPEGTPQYVWGSSAAAIGYTTLQLAQAQAASIGGGTVGTPRP